MSQLRRGEEGFALPITIFLVTLLTIMLSAAFTRAAVDRQITYSSGATLEALTIAQSGLQTFLGDTFTAPPASGDSIRYNVQGGYAWVLPTLLRQPADPVENSTYIVTSTGYLIEPNQGSDPQARRTVAQFAEWQTANMGLLGTIVAINEFREKNNSSLTQVSGVDACDTLPDIPGVRSHSGGITVDDGTFGGNPGLLDLGTELDVANASGVDWTQVTGGGFAAEYSAFQPWDLTFPSQFITGDFTLSDSRGSGLLIVTGDFETAGTFSRWDGIILVGRRFRLRATFNIFEGTIISGLDELLGSPVGPRSELGGNGKYTWYNYCSTDITESLRSLEGFIPISNAWVDNWATY